MKIGIIGAGHIGSALTHRLTELGHTVKVANSRGPETLKDLAAATGATPVTADQAATDVDLLVITIPEKRIADLPKDLLQSLDKSIPVVDTGNYYPIRDGRIDDIENGLTESRWVEKQLNHPVIKAFNNIYAQKLLDGHKPAGADGRIALPVAGDNKAAKGTVMKLIDKLGFDPIDDGDLDNSWRQQPGTPVYGTMLDAQATRKALASTSPDRPSEFRAQKDQ